MIAERRGGEWLVVVAEKHQLGCWPESRDQRDWAPDYFPNRRACSSSASPCPVHWRSATLRSG